MDSVPQTCLDRRRARTTADLPSALGCLADDITITSPLTNQFRFDGHARARVLLTAVFAVVENVTLLRDIGYDTDRCLSLRTCVRGVPLDEVQLLRFDDTGRIVNLMLYVRPLTGATALAAAIGPQLVARPFRHTVTRTIATSFASAARLADRRIVPWARPAEPLPSPGAVR